MTDDRVRVTLDPGTRTRRERQHSTPGIAMVGGVHFLNGVAYVPRASTLVRRLQSGDWYGAAVSTDVDAEQVTEHEQRLDAILHPPAKPAPECRPGFCVYGGREAGHACRSLYPHNFPPPPEPRPGVAL